MPLADYTAWVKSWAFPRKIDPVMASVRSRLPAVALVGRIEAIRGAADFRTG